MLSMKTALALAALLGATLAAQAQPPARDLPPASPDTNSAAVAPEYAAARARWRRELEAFARSDQAAEPAPGGVVFVGSSSLRLWKHLAQDFAQVHDVVNRGFGGSTMADCSLFAQELVVRYRPRQVLVYAGDNDLAEGRTPLQVLASFARFANAVREALPGTRISFISVKPSPSRMHLLPQVRETNDVIAAYLRTQANTEYIDVYTPMMGADNRPRAELFLGDRLHLNEAGYRLWQSVIAQHLTLPATPPQP